MQHADDRSDGPETTTALGRRAEDLALRHLECAGLRLLTRNYRCRGGEIDLVMLDAAARVLVLVEVRSRSRVDFGSAEPGNGSREMVVPSTSPRFQ